HLQLGNWATSYLASFSRMKATISLALDMGRARTYDPVEPGGETAMKRWLALLMLLASSSGCMMFEDLIYHDDSPPWAVQATAEAPMGTCGQPIRNVSWAQT